jgi:hypothetical protein
MARRVAEPPRSTTLPSRRAAISSKSGGWRARCARVTVDLIGNVPRVLQDARLRHGVEHECRFVEDEIFGTMRMSSAIATRWRSPPESLTPCSPTMVSWPEGNEQLNAWARGACCWKAELATHSGGVFNPIGGPDYPCRGAAGDSWPIAVAVLLLAPYRHFHPQVAVALLSGQPLDGQRLAHGTYDHSGAVTTRMVRRISSEVQQTSPVVLPDRSLLGQLRIAIAQPSRHWSFNNP